MLLADLTGLIEGIVPEKRFVLLLAVIGCSTGILITFVVTVCRTAAQIAHHRGEAELKCEMLDRGMSADEIATVIQATTAADETGRPVLHQDFRNMNCRPKRARARC